MTFLCIWIIAGLLLVLYKNHIGDLPNWRQPVLCILLGPILWAIIFGWVAYDLWKGK